MKILDMTPTFFPADKAEAIAADMTAADLDGWTYRANLDPKDIGPAAQIAVYDEEGEFVAFA